MKFSSHHADHVLESPCHSQKGISRLDQLEQIAVPLLEAVGHHLLLGPSDGVLQRADRGADGLHGSFQGLDVAGLLHQLGMVLQHLLPDAHIQRSETILQVCHCSLG